MHCKKCGNVRSFIVEGKELRVVDTENPQEIKSHFVVTKAVCRKSGCNSTQVELDPLHPSLKPYKSTFGLPG